MNKVFVSGWIYNIDVKDFGNGKVIAYFQIKTKNTVRGVRPYDYIDCNIIGKKAVAIRDNIQEGDPIIIIARLAFDEEKKLSLAVDEIQFL